MEDDSYEKVKYQYELDTLLQKYQYELDIQLHKYQYDCGAQLHRYDAHCAQSRDMFNATITYGIAATRGIFLLNGGAAAAILSSASAQANTSLARTCLIFFSLGALIATVCSGSTYISQYIYTDHYNKHAHKVMSDENYVYKETKIGIVIHIISIILWLASIYLFIRGLFLGFPLLIPTT